MALNIVAISGNLTKDPEVRPTHSGSTVMNFTVAVNNRRKTQTGEWKDDPAFIPCVLFGHRAEALRPYLHKGAKVSVSGRISQSNWETQDGQKRSRLEVVITDLEFMSAKNGGAGNAQYSQPTPNQSYQQSYQQTYQQTEPAQTYQQPYQPQMIGAVQDDLSAQNLYEDNIPF